jgi:hypothetical protein
MIAPNPERQSMPRSLTKLVRSLSWSRVVPQLHTGDLADLLEHDVAGARPTTVGESPRHVCDDIAHGHELRGVLVRDGDPEEVLELHHELDGIETHQLLRPSAASTFAFA